jgi:selenide,water dikinase
MPAGAPDWKRKLISDPQTSGGLLVACSPAAEKRVIEEFLGQGFTSARRIGSMQAGAPRLAVI